MAGNNSSPSSSHPPMMAPKATASRPKSDLQDGKRPAREDIRPIPQKRFKTAAGRGSNSSRKIENPPVVKPTPDRQSTTNENFLGENEVTTGKDAFLLLQQWSNQGYFQARVGLDFLSAYKDLWRIWEQKPEFPADINIGILRGDAARAGLWLQLVNTTSSVSRTTQEVRGEELAEHQSVLAALRSYRFNTRVTEMALGHLMAQRLAVCKRSKPPPKGSSSHGANLDTLEQELDVLRGRLEDLQIEVEQKEQEVEACRAAIAAEEEATRSRAEIDLLEEAISHLG